jgi:hypothetical protein
MALLDPSDDTLARPASSDHEKTNHPLMCVMGGFGFIVATALVVHVVFNVLV